MEYLKNPIIIGLLASGICFLYLKWKAHKKEQENPDEKIEEPSMKYPIVFGVIVFIGLSLWNFSQKTTKTIENINMKMPTDIIASSPMLPVPSFGESVPHVFIETA